MRRLLAQAAQAVQGQADQHGRLAQPQRGCGWVPAAGRRLCLPRPAACRRHPACCAYACLVLPWLPVATACCAASCPLSIGHVSAWPLPLPRLPRACPAPLPAERVAISQLPTAEAEFYESQAAAGLRTDASASHIFFKDLKLLAHDEDSEEEEGEGQGEGAVAADAGAGGPVGPDAQPGAAYASLDRLNSGAAAVLLRLVGEAGQQGWPGLPGRARPARTASTLACRRAARHDGGRPACGCLRRPPPARRSRRPRPQRAASAASGASVWTARS